MKGKDIWSMGIFIFFSDWRGLAIQIHPSQSANGLFSTEEPIPARATYSEGATASRV